MKQYIFIIGAYIFAGLLVSCHEEPIIIGGETEQCGEIQNTGIGGFYLLNEGNMGSNKATIDYYDYTTATYHRNIYPSANPNAVKELGDVGNDICIYGSRLYAVINASNKIEVMDASSTKRIGQIDIPNCRYLRFHDGYGYITSYAGPIQVNPNYEQKGYVARFDTATLKITDECVVGFQPDGLEIVGNKIYVANSGGYMTPNYENTMSVIDMVTFTETKRITVAVNLNLVCADSYRQLWVTSRGDYYSTPSRLYCIDTDTDEISDSLDLAVSNLWLDGDSLYTCCADWSYVNMQSSNSFAIVNTKTHSIVCNNWISDGTDSKIKKPYGLMVNPVTKEIYLTDAKDYVTPGTLYCFSPQGKRLWSVRTGDIPAHFALKK